MNYPNHRVPVVLTVLRCPTCGRGYTTRWRLRRHIQLHTANSADAFAIASAVDREPSPAAWSCVECSREFGTLKGLSIHARLSRHGGALAAKG